MFEHQSDLQWQMGSIPVIVTRDFKWREQKVILKFEKKIAVVNITGIVRFYYDKNNIFLYG